MAVMNTIELEGASTDSWEDAAAEVVREAARTLRNIRRIEILGRAGRAGDGGVSEYRTRVRLYFEIER